jgi:hypothetical protein
MGNANTAAGFDALYSNEGSENTAIGALALHSHTSGDDNVALGNQAGQSLVTGSNNVYVGSDAGSSNESNTMRLGNTSILNATFIGGVHGTTVTGVPVLINKNGQLGVQTSSARYKQDIAPMADRSESLMQLKPVTFHYKQDPEGPLEYGLIAEQVGAIYPDLVVRGDDGQIEAIRYQELTPMLLNELQRQAQMLQQREKQLDDMAVRLNALERRADNTVR